MGKGHFLSRERVRKAQLSRTEHDVRTRYPAAVSTVADEGHFAGSELDADLVRPARQQTNLQQRQRLSLMYDS